MKLFPAYLCAIVLLVCCYWVPSQAVDDVTTTSTEPAVPTTTTTTTTTTPPPKPPITDNTTKEPPTTTTSTTTEPPTTTTTTTTEPPTTSTTTTSTATTTTTTTTTPTTPSPQPSVPTFEVKDKNGSVCIVIQALTSLKFTYLDKMNVTQNKEFDLKEERIESVGDCQPDKTFISLSWIPHGMATPSFWHLDLTFSKFSDALINAEANSYGVSRIALNYTVDDALFPNATKLGQMLVSANGTIFKAHMGKYYSCSASETIQLKGTDDHEVLLHTQDTKIQAYEKTSDASPFVSDAESCDADSKTSSLVPILVGVGLAIMILIALVVFLIGSRRRAATYESL